MDNSRNGEILRSRYITCGFGLAWISGNGRIGGERRDLNRGMRGFHLKTPEKRLKNAENLRKKNRPTPPDIVQNQQKTCRKPVQNWSNAPKCLKNSPLEVTAKAVFRWI